MASSYIWSQLLDLARRQGANSVQVSPADGLLIAQMVSSRMYTAYPWEFTLTNTPRGLIQCVDGQQDYASPNDCYRLVRAWFYTTPVVAVTPDPDSPQPSDPGYAAYIASLNYVDGAGTTTYPPQTRNLDVVKTLSIHLNRGSWAQIGSICQVGNSRMWRLSQATAIDANFPFELQSQYQPFAPQFTDLGQQPWFPDEYVDTAIAGFLYYLYQFNNDPRAGGAAKVQPNGTTQYTGQLGAWKAQVDEAAANERDGSVDTFAPTDVLGNDYGGAGWFGGWW